MEEMTEMAAPVASDVRAAPAVVETMALCDTVAGWVREPPAGPPAWPPERWWLFRQVCQAHGVAPLLARRLGWPASTAAGSWLAAQYAANRQRVAKIHDELRQILAAFAAAGVPLVPLKGAPLGILLYDDPAERPMADLDFLLRPDDLERAAPLLAGLGYEKIWTGWKHLRFARPENRQVVDPSCEHPDNPRVLELHPRCRERLRDQMIDLTDSIWEAVRPGELLGQRSWLLEPAACWLQLAVHATHHIMMNRFRLIQLLDLALLAGGWAGWAGASVGVGAAASVGTDSPAGAAGAAGAAGDYRGGRCVERLPDLLSGVDPRAIYAPLALLERYCPGGATAALAAAARVRVAPSFAAWAEALDLYHASYLDPAPWRDP
ncbi:MAG TPA: nucleotidyltransferase family protein [Thermoanaerobaculia bacterium]|nr:nucleotidyltransferase family protein [Thermoanaerobaculia bacterium]